MGSQRRWRPTSASAGKELEGLREEKAAAKKEAAEQRAAGRAFAQENAPNGAQEAEVAQGPTKVDDPIAHTCGHA